MNDNENTNQDNKMNFQNMIDNNVSINNDVLNDNVLINDNINNIHYNSDNVIKKESVEKNNIFACSYCECCGRLIDNEGNLLGIDGDNKDLLINAFIGNKADKIRKQKFSINTFIFSYFYFAYRKMYLYGLYLFLFNLAFFYFFVFLLNEFSFISPIIFYVFWFLGLLIINARLSLNFKKIYLRFIKDKIKKIEMNNRVNLYSLVCFVKKNGGINKFFIVLYILNIILNLLILFFALILKAAYG